MADPTRTIDCNCIFHGSEGSEIGDLPVEIDGDVLRSYWKPTQAERIAILDGGYIVLEVLSSQHPPVKVTTTKRGP